MNIKLRLPESFTRVGMFAKFTIMFYNTIPYDVDHLYFYEEDTGRGENPFDWVFEQYYDDSFMDIQCQHLGVYTNSKLINEDYLGAIEDAPEFSKMKGMRSKIVIKKCVLDKVAEYINLIEPDTLGVHVRLGPMNTWHPQFGIASTQTYIDKIKELNPKSIYLASDNDESIKKIREAVDCKIIVIKNLMREDIDNMETDNIHINFLYADYYWRQVWADMLLLSRCNELLCRVSNFANAAIIFSDTFKKIHRL